MNDRERELRPEAGSEGGRGVSPRPSSAAWAGRPAAARSRPARARCGSPSTPPPSPRPSPAGQWRGARCRGGGAGAGWSDSTAGVAGDAGLAAGAGAAVGASVAAGAGVAAARAGVATAGAGVETAAAGCTTADAGAATAAGTISAALLLGSENELRSSSLTGAMEHSVRVRRCQSWWGGKRARDHICSRYSRAAARKKPSRINTVALMMHFDRKKTCAVYLLQLSDVPFLQKN